MNDTKEKILVVALELFARDGYEAVSVSQISGELGMTKSALYKHYKNKRDIFDSIVKRMKEMDYERAKKYEMPEGTIEETAEAYSKTSLEKIKIYSIEQFKYWTEEEFPCLFRKMLTLEQYRNEEMGKLYQQYLAKGPVQYMEDLFSSMTGDAKLGRHLALEFYSPMYLMYNIYDEACDKEAVIKIIQEHIERFSEKLK